ncbi:MAG: pectate lyase, partial [Bacteroidales bacterium]
MTKRLLFIAVLLLTTTFLRAQSVNILESAGWLESAFVKWTPLADADSYHVYYSGEGITDKKIDDQLIRSYGTYFRADMPGLKAGNYTFKVKPVTDGVEGVGAETALLSVASYDRSGFAFSNGRMPGAYQADGTPKNNAVILYVTEKTKNTISLDVTGANANPCVGLQAILDGFKKGRDLRPLIVRFVGQITDLAEMLNGDIVVENNRNVSSYITLEGIGEDAVLDGWGIRIKNATNIEVRNVGTMNCNSSEGDNISLQQNNDYVWVHHCDFFYGDAGGDSDQAKGDGALDCKTSTYVTFSYNHFWDSGKSNLLGLSEDTTDGLYISYHHNWYDHSDSRHPRVRFYSAHVYNNYYDGIAKYGVGATSGSSVFVEKNYFRNCKNPMMISMQGTDTKMGTDEKDAPTFSKEDGGIIKAFDNYLTGNYTFAPYSAANLVHFDAYVAVVRDEKVPTGLQTKKGAHKYNNFDTDASVMYHYNAHETNEVVDVVTKYAGRMNGGDFKWTFNNAVDDASYAVNPALKAALSSYKTTLVAIQGESPDNGNGGGNGDGDGNGGVITGDIIHNFTTEGKI